MLKSARKKLRNITFYLESIFQREKLLKNPRAINMVRAWKMGDKNLAVEIINAVSAPLKVSLSGGQYEKNINFVIWEACNATHSKFKINFDQDEDAVKSVAERIFHLLPLIQKFHQSPFLKRGL